MLMGKVTHHVMQPLEGAREKTMNTALKHCCIYQAWDQAQVSAQFSDLTLEWTFLVTFSGTFISYFMLLSPVNTSITEILLPSGTSPWCFKSKMKSVFFLYYGLERVLGLLQHLSAGGFNVCLMQWVLPA